MNKEKGPTKRPLKVAVLLSQFPCISETFILNQINYLVEQGHQIDIYSYGDDHQPVHPQVQKNRLIEKTRYVQKVYSRLSRLKHAFPLFLHSKEKMSLVKTLNAFKYGMDSLSLKLFYQTEPYRKNRKYDIVHAHFGKMGIEAIRLKELGFFSDTPIITSFHGYDINPKYIDDFKVMYRKLFEVSDYITANSLFTLDLIKKAGCPPAKIVKIPEALDTSFFKRDETVHRNGDVVRIVFCGRLIEFKAPELVPEIANILIHERGHKNVEFHMIGSGPLQEKVMAAIQKHKLEAKVIMHGAMRQDDIMKLMGKMDIFLYPGINDLETGRSENQGLVIQEAQAMELPVVTSNAGGIPEGLIDGKTGFVLEQRDLLGFSDKLELLMKDPKLRKTMGIEGRNFVVDKFDVHPLGTRLEALYNMSLDLPTYANAEDAEQLPLLNLG
jgi:colanic acid/amylovoran biosynthesis glycosyltransferase